MPNVNDTSFAVWLLSIAAHALLSGLIIQRKALRRNLWLFMFSSTYCVVDIPLMLLYRTESYAGYFWTYWAARFVLAIFQFGIIWTIARALVGVNRIWRHRLVECMFVLTIAALAISAAITLSSPAPFYLAVTRVVTSIDRWVSLAACILFVMLTFSLDILGIKWRRETLAVGLGLSVQGATYTCFSWLITVLRLSQQQWQTPSVIRDIADLFVIAIWIYAFTITANRKPSVEVSTKKLQAALEKMQHAASQM